MLHRRHGFALFAIAMLAAACGGSSPAPTATADATAAPTTAAATAVAASADPVASAAVGAGVSISDLLGGTAAAPASTAWVRISDTTSPFTYEVPSTWTVHSAYPWTEKGTTIGTALAAGPDLARLTLDFSVPAVVIGVGTSGAATTPRQVVEGGSQLGSGCIAGDIQEATETAGSAAYRLWTGCGGSGGVLLLMVIAPAGQQGLIEVVFQGVSQQDLGYLDHIVGSLAATGGARPPSPPPTGGSVAGPTYTISMTFCANQHGQGVAEGLIRNDDGLVHTWRIVVAFLDPNGVFLNDTDMRTSDIAPGVTATWQAMVPSGLPAVTVSCTITAVELVR